MCMAAWLSHQSFVGVEVSMPTSKNDWCIHMISQIDCVMTLYSDSRLGGNILLLTLL